MKYSVSQGAEKVSSFDTEVGDKHTARGDKWASVTDLASYTVNKLLQLAGIADVPMAEPVWKRAAWGKWEGTVVLANDVVGRGVIYEIWLPREWVGDRICTLYLNSWKFDLWIHGHFRGANKRAYELFVYNSTQRDRSALRPTLKLAQAEFLAALRGYVEDAEGKNFRFKDLPTKTRIPQMTLVPRTWPFMFVEGAQNFLVQWGKADDESAEKYFYRFAYRSHAEHEEIRTEVRQEA
jgi:hypothetical protein